MQSDERAELRSRNDALRAQVDSMLAALDRQQQHMAEVTERLARATTEARSADGLVRVVVNAAGIPTQVHLDPEAFKRSRPERLGESMVEAAQAAAHRAAESTRAAIAPVQEIAARMPDLSDLVPGAPSLRALLPPRVPDPAKTTHSADADDETWGQPILRHETQSVRPARARAAEPVDEDGDVWGGSILRESR